MTKNTAELSNAGVSIWLDDLSRELLNSGDLQTLIKERDVVGVTTNPTIFASALAKGDAYADDVRKLASENASVPEAITHLTTTDVAAACDIFSDIYRESKGFDGRVSIEVSPGLANDTAETIVQAQELFDRVDRENVLIKIPATLAGLEAITQTIAKGISVNVTLIFSLPRYREVMNAYLRGLELAREAGHDLTKIHSVASFFVSRVDAEVNKRLDAIGSEAALAAKSKAGLANARLAYQVWEETFQTERAQELLAAGANTQRPLWASTGVKDESLPDTLYVTGLVANDVVNTMPAKTLEATADHGEVTGDTIRPNLAAAQQDLDTLHELGVSYEEVTNLLEIEAVEKFMVSWQELVDTVSGQLGAAKSEV
ncbi:transaldolase [Humidisolicoccus flavus]|uniref:transaldolase n=1 Tax=Humidisolicoccus flavus TaxID=3111414 RepID=UPI003252A42D